MALKNTVKTVKQATAALHLLTRWNNSTARELYQVYNSYSYKKYNSYEHIKAECSDADGSGLVITSHNCNVYACMYIAPAIDEATGALEPALVYHTAYNRRVYLISDIIKYIPDCINHPAIIEAYRAARLEFNYNIAV